MTNVTKLTDLEKQAISDSLQKAYRHHGSWAKVANVCQQSEATVSLMAKGKYSTQGDAAWLKVRAVLDSTPSTGWQIAETKNQKEILRVLQVAKEKSMWLPISEKAGSGKTVTTKLYYNQDKSQSVFRLECRNWGRKEFLQRLCRTLGLNPDQGHKSCDDLIEMATDFFKLRSASKPILIIDQGNSVKPSAFTSLIYIFNECEGFLACVVLGTENLEKAIRRGVKYNIDGFDELDSRLGRNYIHLTGYSKDDVKRIAEANGIKDTDTQTAIFEECKPIRKVLSDNKGQQATIRIVEDGRRIKRCIERELLKQVLN